MRNFDPFRDTEMPSFGLRRREGRGTLPICSDKKIVEESKKFAGNIADTARSLGIHGHQVRKVLRRNGAFDPLAQRRPGGKGAGPQKKRVNLKQFDALVSIGMTKIEAARVLGVTTDVVNRRRKKSEGS